MSATAIAATAFACIFGSAWLGMLINRALPARYLSQGTKDVVKLGAGLIATLAALVLSLLITSAKASFDDVNDELLHSAAKAILLDRILSAYGPEAQELRDLLKHSFATVVEQLFSADRAQLEKLDSLEAVARGEHVQAKLRELVPRNDSQRELQSRAAEIVGEMSSTRWLLLLQTQGSVPMPLVIALVFWLAIVFATFGLLAPHNATVVVILCVCALSAAGAIFLILEMDEPLAGLIRVSSGPMRNALAHIGQ